MKGEWNLDYLKLGCIVKVEERAKKRPKTTMRQMKIVRY